jgi:pyruvate/2-oxoglutarate/acetoin dehydrogenase E1 component/biotin carboxyl carrier protein
MTAQLLDTKKMSNREAISLALDVALSADPRVFMIGEDLADPAGGVSGLTKGLSTKHGLDRVLDTPISEAAIIGAAIGAAMEGMIPVAEIMIMDFITIATDQMINHAAKARFMSNGRTTAPITIRTSTFAGLGSGATHSQSLEAWFMHIPGLKVVMPSTPADLKGLLLESIFDPDPVLFIETSALHAIKGEVPLGDVRIPLGVADIKRPGNDVTIITYGAGVFRALDAAAALEVDGIDAEVIDLRTLVPLDRDAILASVRRTGPCRRHAHGHRVRRARSRDRLDHQRGAVQRVEGARRATRGAVPTQSGLCAGTADAPLCGHDRRSSQANDGVHTMSNTVSVQVPKLTMAAVEAVFLGWLVEDGAQVTAQQPIYTVATDKVEVEVESPAAGILRHGDVEEDEDYLVGHELGVIEID